MTVHFDTSVTEVCHIVKGAVVRGGDIPYGPPHARFATPALDLNALVWQRTEPGPAFDVPLDEILDVLDALADWIGADPEGLMDEALQSSIRLCPLPAEVMRANYDALPAIFRRETLLFQITNELGGRALVDGWARVAEVPGNRCIRMRAFPTRMLHIVAGNSPGVTAVSIARGAITKGVNLFKIPSNDLFTAPALLRGLAAVAPGHPLVRSFSAVYWQGGDAAVEGMLMRPQFFDKLVAWGGESTLATAKKYICPGFDLVAFDPKTSISLIGHEAFESADSLAEAADRAAADATLLEQTACASSRFQFVEGTEAEADRFAEALQKAMGVARPMATATGTPVPATLREEIDGLRAMDGLYGIFGGYDGSGLVIRSEEPVDFHPEFRIINVVPVASLAAAVKFVNVATQTVGVYPSRRKAEVRDLLASAGAQRIVALGGAGRMERGVGHDGFLPLQRLVRWVNDED
jgi:hypothetical protein